MPVTVTISQPSGITLSSEVKDISGGGLCFQVPVGSVSLDRDTRLPLRVNLPNGQIVPATIIIRHLIPEGGMIRVGAQFCALSTVGREKICDYVIQATLGEDRLSLSHLDFRCQIMVRIQLHEGIKDLARVLEPS